jgi:hypothetical protein
MAFVLLEAVFELVAPAADGPDPGSDIFNNWTGSAFRTQGGGGTSSTTCSVEIKIFRDICGLFES